MFPRMILLHSETVFSEMLHIAASLHSEMLHSGAVHCELVHKEMVHSEMLQS